MNREGHVEEMLSAYLDGEVDGGTRARVEAHLATCPGCTEARERLARTVAAVRSLPTAPMPRTVVLPPEAPRQALPAWERAAALLRRRPAIPALGLAAAGVAAVVIAVHGGSGAGPGSTASSAGQRGDGAAALAAPGSCSVETVAGAPGTAASAGAALPAGFANQVTVAVPGRPGQTLIVATPRRAYSPGESVPVYVRLVTGGTPVALSGGCLRLGTAAGTFAAAGAGAPTAMVGEGRALSVPGPLSAGKDAGTGIPVLVISLPSSPGPVSIVASAPGEPDILAVLSLSVG